MRIQPGGKKRMKDLPTYIPYIPRTLTANNTHLPAATLPPKNCALGVAVGGGSGAAAAAEAPHPFPPPTTSP